MDFIDQVKTLALRLSKLTTFPETEEATKTSLIMPFISMLGYDVFDLDEVIPEFTADVGTKKGEKIDYAIISEGKPVMLIECKSYGTDLEKEHASQLFRYFATQSGVRFGILTNGLIYRFFCDLDETNKMDEKPFFEFILSNFTDAQVEELKRFTKNAFSMDSILTAAWDLKYTKELKRFLAEQMLNPSEEMIKFCASQIYQGRLTPKVREQFSGIVKRALQQFINERINERLKSALQQEEGGQPEKPDSKNGEGKENEPTVTTSEDEIQGFYIVKAILASLVDVKRLTLRDAKHVCSILLDDTNRKPVCKFLFNNPEKKQFVIVGADADKKETSHAIQSVEDIFLFADQLRSRVSFIEKPLNSNTQPLKDQ